MRFACPFKENVQFITEAWKSLLDEIDWLKSTTKS